MLTVLKSHAVNNGISLELIPPHHKGNGMSGRGRCHGRANSFSLRVTILETAYDQISNSALHICKGSPPKVMHLTFASIISLVPRLHSPAFLALCEKSWGVEPGNEAKYYYLCMNMRLNYWFVAWLMLSSQVTATCIHTELD